MSSEAVKKPSFMSRLFSTSSSAEEEAKERAKKRMQRLHSVDVATFRDKNSTGFFGDDSKPAKKDPKAAAAVKEDSGDKVRRKQSVPAVSSSLSAVKDKSHRHHKKTSAAVGGSAGDQKRLRRRKKASLTGVQVDTTKPLEYPTTPEMIYEYHKRKPFLDKNEEWLVMELNEYECLVESLEVIKIIAKHSKFFEVEPDELWEEFFEYMEEVSSYDEMINYDVWQEFRDNKYPC